MSSFFKRLKDSAISQNSHLCIGLDPEFEKIPDKFKSSSTPYLDFNRAIIDATHDLVLAYKPQFAHYAAFGRENELLATIDYIKKISKNIIVILDSKRGDIGNTANYYAKESFERYGADSVTVNPYMGYDSIAPFTQNQEKGAFILCRTSNPSSNDFQDVISKNSNLPLYQIVAGKVSNDWNENNNCGLVLGATFPVEMKIVRDIVGPNIPFLVPGIGAQGGDLKSVMESAYSGAGSLIINSSRGIIHKDSSENCDKVARAQSLILRDQINELCKCA